MRHQLHHGWCSFILPSSTTMFNLTTATPSQPHRTMPPGAPLRDVGLINNAPQQGQGEENRYQLHLPVPVTEGCGWLINTQRRSWGGRNVKGDPRSGRASWYITKTNHDFGHGLFSSFFSTFPTSDRFYAQCWHFKPNTSISNSTWSGHPHHGHTNDVNASAVRANLTKRQCEHNYGELGPTKANKTQRQQWTMSLLPAACPSPLLRDVGWSSFSTEGCAMGRRKHGAGGAWPRWCIFTLFLSFIPPSLIPLHPTRHVTFWPPTMSPDERLTPPWRMHTPIDQTHRPLTACTTYQQYAICGIHQYTPHSRSSHNDIGWAQWGQWWRGWQQVAMTMIATTTIAGSHSKNDIWQYQPMEGLGTARGGKPPHCLVWTPTATAIDEEHQRPRWPNRWNDDHGWG